MRTLLQDTPNIPSQDKEVVEKGVPQSANQNRSTSQDHMRRGAEQATNTACMGGSFDMPPTRLAKRAQQKCRIRSSADGTACLDPVTDMAQLLSEPVTLGEIAGSPGLDTADIENTMNLNDDTEACRMPHGPQ